MPLRLFDTAAQAITEVTPVRPGVASMYVCGITPYDSTHLGHAATYVTFDLIYRQLLDNGLDVHYVQNVTDVDDPLFERAQRDGVDWRELGTSQIDLFRSDMEQLSVFPPQDFVGAMEAVGEVIAVVQRLLDNDAAYQLDDEYPDIYFRIGASEHFGYESHYDDAAMEKYFAERGGDPDRAGKDNPLDALLWRAARPEEPSWEAPFGAGRPGWHIECSAIAMNRLFRADQKATTGFDIQGGGSDLAFPHHEFSAAHAECAYPIDRMASHYVHGGMIGLDGTKMSKSLGNLVFVSKLTAAGTDPAAIRLGLYSGHYRDDRNWSDDVLEEASQRLATWRQAVALHGELEDQDFAADELAPATVISKLRAHLANDLDTPAALATIDQWAQQVIGAAGDGAAANAAPGDLESSEAAPAAHAHPIAIAVDALLGVKL